MSDPTSSNDRLPSPIPGPSRKEVKQARRLFQSKAFCTNCQRNVGTKQCSNCILYCSTECQKEDWPEHKAGCAQSTTQDLDVKKICQTLMANELLRRHIEILVIFKCDLLKKLGSRQPFRVQIILDFEPVNILDFFRLFKPSAVIDQSPMKGMLQICDGLPEELLWGTSQVTSFFSDTPTLDERRQVSDLLADIREEDPLPFGVIQFLQKAGRKTMVASNALSIHKESMEIARQGKEVHIPLPGRTIKRHLTANSCIELVNALIRNDVDNQWLLRMNMTPADKQEIKDAASAVLSNPGSTSTIFSIAIKAKATRDAIYQTGSFIRT